MLEGDRSRGDDLSDNGIYSGGQRKDSFFADKSCVIVFFALAGFVGLIFVFLCVIFGLSWPPQNRENCFNGSSLNKNEQMWCNPKKKTDILAIREMDENVSFYIFNLNELPNVTSRSQHLHEEYLVPLYQTKYHSFSLMAEGQIFASLSSNDPDDKWYLLDEDAMDKYLESEPFTPIEESEYNMSLDFQATSPGEYYITVFNTRGKDSTVVFDVDVVYRKYDIDPDREEAPCKDQVKCIIKDVEPSQMIIAMNRGNETLTVGLIAVETDGLNAFFYVFVPIVLALVAIALVVFPLVMMKRMSNSSQERTPFRQSLTVHGARNE